MAQALMVQSSMQAMAVAQPDVAPPREITDNQREAMREASAAIIGRLDRLAMEEVGLRRDTETRWLNNLRAYHGRYDEITEKSLKDSEGKRSRAFIKLSRAKSDAWEARLSDMLFPADDRNWGIKPTPVADLVREAREMVKLAIASAQEANRAGAAQNVAIDKGRMDVAIAAADQASQARDAAQAYADRAREANATAEEAKKRSDGMQRVMEDQLTECLYPKRCRDIIGDMVRIGPGVLKGPLTANRPSRAWEHDPATGVYRLNVRPDPKPNYTRVDPWNFFPEHSATSMEDCEYSFERHLPSTKDLRKLGQTMGFDVDAIRRLIQNGPLQATDMNTMHIAQIRSITGEGQNIKGRYVMWEYHGPLQKDEIVNMLYAAGRDQDAVAVENDDDPFEQRLVRIFFCNGELLALHEVYPMDSGESLYSVVSFQRGEASVMGAVGVPEILADTERALNGAWRMTLDNAGLSVGPQIAIDKNAIEPEDGDWTIRPMKVWLKKVAETNANARPFEAINIPNNQAQLAGIIALAREFADEECALPLIAQGDQGAHVTDTMGGMAILSNAANIIFRRVVKNWDDDLTTPSIRRLYDWNMQFNDDPDIKGDMNIDARGTSVLLVKELQSQNLMLITQNWSAHPVLAPMLKSQGYHAARMTLQAMNIPPDEIFESEEEYNRKYKEAQDSAAQSPPPEQLNAESRIKAAEIAAQSRADASQVQLQIAQLNRETEMMKIAEDRNMTLDQVRAALAGKKMEIDSKERTFAAEAAIEDQNRVAAEARGLEPTGSGGSISMGAEKE